VDLGITNLGLGKNMVQALRCWIEAFQVAAWNGKSWSLTEMGQFVFSPKNGLDPYLEDHSTNWLLHWLICTDSRTPFFAWECLFNRWSSVDFSASTVLEAFRNESRENPRPASAVTLKQHWDVFLHSYRPPRGGTGEDHLDCALSVLGLIREAGEVQNAAGKWEPRYEFDVAGKSGLPQQLFAFFIHDWWARAFPAEQTVPLHELVSGDHSPGRLLKMQESEVVRRVTDLAQAGSHGLQLADSMNLRQLHRVRTTNWRDSLRAAYTSPRFL
jgi:hypothetical protein